MSSSPLPIKLNGIKTKNSVRMEAAVKKAPPDILTYSRGEPLEQDYVQYLLVHWTCSARPKLHLLLTQSSRSTISNVSGFLTYPSAGFASCMMGSVFFFCLRSHGKVFGVHCKHRCLTKVQTVGFSRQFPDF